jgi:nucleotidyltransferase/DNA polymerase involved in DNA repair
MIRRRGSSCGRASRFVTPLIVTDKNQKRGAKSTRKSDAPQPNLQIFKICLMWMFGFGDDDKDAFTRQR